MMGPIHMGVSELRKPGRFRRAVWLLPILLVTVILAVLLILADGGSLSAFSYRSF
jgi:hypothetical protein